MKGCWSMILESKPKESEEFPCKHVLINKFDYKDVPC